MASNTSRDRDEGVAPVPVNADLEIPDKIIGPFTARQAAILAAGGVVLWLTYAALHRLVPPVVLLIAALIVGGALVTTITSKRDGLSLDRYLLAAIRHHHQGNRYVNLDHDEPVPDGLERIELPVAGLDEAGVLDLGPDGAAVLIECGTVNLLLRSGAEVSSVLTGIGQALNALGGAFQFTVTAHRIDLTARAEQTESCAGALAHPLLEQRARDYAGLLRGLSSQHDLIARRVLLVLREPGPAQHAAPGVLHRAAQAATLLTGAGVTTRILSAPEASAALQAGAQPHRAKPATRQCPPGRAVQLAPDLTASEHATGPAGDDFGPDPTDQIPEA